MHRRTPTTKEPRIAGRPADRSEAAVASLASCYDRHSSAVFSYLDVFWGSSAAADVVVTVFVDHLADHLLEQCSDESARVQLITAAHRTATVRHGVSSDVEHRPPVSLDVASDTMTVERQRNPCGSPSGRLCPPCQQALFFTVTSTGTYHDTALALDQTAEMTLVRLRCALAQRSRWLDV